LNSFSLNMTSGVLLLTFNKAISVASFYPAALHISDGCVGSDPSCQLLLTSGSASLPSLDVISLTLSYNDLNDLKARPLIGSSNSSTRLFFDSTLVTDLSGNAIVPVQQGMSLAATDVIPDSLAPFLRLFILDMNLGVISVSYSETVNPVMLNETVITVQDQPTANFSVTLTSTLPYTLLRPYTVCSGSLPSDTCRMCTQCSVGQYLQIPCTISSDSVCQSCSSCSPGFYVASFCSSEANTACQSCTSNCLSCSGPGSTCRSCATNFYLLNGVCIPSCPLGYYQDSGVCTACDATCATCFAHSASSCTSCMGGLILSGSVCVNTCSAGYFADFDTHSCVACDSSCLTCFDANATSCTSCGGGLAFYEHQCLNSCPTGLYQYPLTSQCQACPTDCASCDMSGTCLTCTNGAFLYKGACLSFCPAGYFGNFASSFTGRTCSACSNCSQGAALISSCSPGFDTSCSSFAEAMLSFSLSNSDLNAIKRQPPLGTSTNTSFITFSRFEIADMSGNQVMPILNGDAFPAFQLIPDTTSPALISFSLNMATGNMILQFSEVVNPNNLLINQFTLYDSISGLGAYHTLQSAHYSLAYSDLITLHISNADLNAIKLIPSLARSANSSCLAISPSAITDMRSNSVTAIPNSNGLLLAASAYVTDNVPPLLGSFDLNMNNLMLTLSFSESVNTSTLVDASLSISSSPSPTAYVLSLFGGETNSVNSAIVVVSLSAKDGNALKRMLGLAKNISTTYISFTAGAIKDMFGNSIAAVSLPGAIEASQYVPHTTDPWLVAYSFDANLGQLQLTFSETVNASSFDPTQLTILGANFQGPQYTLTGMSNVLSAAADSTVLTVQLLSFDLNAIKAIRSVAKSLFSTYLSVTTGLLRMKLDCLLMSPSTTLHWKHLHM